VPSRPRITSPALIFALALTVVAGAPAQETASPPATPDTYFLRTTADALNIRSRADANSHILVRVPENTILRAVGHEYGWHQVFPPAGAFSVVSSDYITRSGPDRGIVNVTSGNLRVRVGSAIHAFDPTESEVQTLLPDGTPVQILGEQDGWLRIAPPPGVYAYVSGDYVERITAADAARRGGPSLATTRPALPPTTRPSVAAEGSPTTAPAAGEPAFDGPWGQRLLLVEAAIEQMSARPLDQQSWDEHLTRLEPIAAQHEEPTVARVAAAWIDKLRDRAAAQQRLAAASEILRRSARERAERAAEIRRLEQLTGFAETQPAYAARGLFLRSAAVREIAGQAWYKLQNPLTLRLEAYLQVSERSVPDVNRVLGKYVGVDGERQDDPELGVPIIRVRKIVVLSHDPPATQPARQTR
jgi:hypothetical protein